MSDNILSSKIGNAAKWSTFSEVTARLIAPITNIILARLLAPEAFGVIAIVVMVVSFAEMITEAGFQDYLVQHEFKDKEEKEKTASVAFWTSLFIALLLYGFIFLFRHWLASAVGNPGLGNVIAVAALQIPISSFTSVQVGLNRRDYNFKLLFLIRMTGSIIPLTITLPLAFQGYGYWAIIIGTLSFSVASAVLFMLISEWKPSFFYSFSFLKRMFTFSAWASLEALAIWLTVWVDIFIIGHFLSEYYVGLYRTSLYMVEALMGIITASMNPVLFSALSRFQNNHGNFTAMFLGAQRLLAFLVFPMGIGIYLYQDFATSFILGSQWTEASTILGLWGLSTSLRLVMINLFSAAYRAKGKPKISLFLLTLDLLIIIPTCIISLQFGFWELIYARAIIKIDLIIPGLIVMNTIIGISASSILKNVVKPLLCTFIMAVFALLLKSISDLPLWSGISIMLCITVYFVSLFYLDKGIVVSAKKIIVSKET
ncbi:lipopolysaccharide biosynthesis protein [Planococcus shixiaomingii]|uniref:lipopolysaccharide biosynthesis protein n=1 Tax=Planococcus shixiaomingii TaxID=3058393 RepID=UPI0026082C86|nr:lipopolysaccharide biosynthesis protein [Planococcus sp. N022]WKA53958.1 lipopolysaccharide biosynthesis protein [Planococcus sp. N022]